MCLRLTLRRQRRRRRRCHSLHHHRNRHPSPCRRTRRCVKTLGFSFTDQIILRLSRLLRLMSSQSLKDEKRKFGCILWLMLLFHPALVFAIVLSTLDSLLSNLPVVDTCACYRCTFMLSYELFPYVRVGERVQKLLLIVTTWEDFSNSDCPSLFLPSTSGATASSTFCSSLPHEPFDSQLSTLYDNPCLHRCPISNVSLSADYQTQSSGR